MNIFLDKERGVAFIDTKDGHGIVVGTVEELEKATDEERAERVRLAVAIFFYEGIKSSKGRIVH